jgi:large subunit ribosomal protein L10
MAGLEKTLMLKEVKDKIKATSNIFFTKVNRINVDDFTKLRQSVSPCSTKAFVVKNTIARIALKDLGLEKCTSAIDGISFLVVADKEIQQVSKELVAFGKDKNAEQFEIRGAWIEGEFVSEGYVKEISKLPSRQVLLANLLGRMNAPITNFVCDLNGIIRSLVIALSEVSKKKGEPPKGDEPPAA